MDEAVVRERGARLQRIAVEMDTIVREVGPKLIRLAHLREEARSIMREVGDAEPQEKH